MQDGMCDLLLAKAVTVQTLAQQDVAGGDDGNDAGLVVTHIIVGLLIASLYEKKVHCITYISLEYFHLQTDVYYLYT